MKFKKLASMILSFVMIFTLATPSFADSKSNYLKQYENYMKQSVQDGQSSKNSGKMSLYLQDIKQLEQMGMKDIKMGVDFKTSSKATVNPLMAEVVADIKLNIPQKVKELIGDVDLNIPQIKLYMDEQYIYLNKEFVNYLEDLTDSEKKVQQDFVKISYNQQGLQNMKQMTAALKENDRITQATIAFLKKIDLGDVSIDLKEDKSVYSVSWDADKFVDVMDALIKYVLLHFDDLVDFYSEMGIDYIKTINDSNKAMGLPTTTKEELTAQLKKGYDEYIKQTAKYIPLVKELLKGSTVSMVEDFSDNSKISSNVKCNLVINMEVLNKFAEDFSPSNVGLNEGKAVFAIENSSESIFSKDIKVQIPTNAMEISEDFFGKINPSKPESKSKDKDDYYHSLMLDTENNSYVLKEGDKVTKKGSIKISMNKGKTMVDSKTLVDILKDILSEEETKTIVKQDMFSIRDLSSEDIYGEYVLIEWDATTKTVSIHL